MDAKLVGFGMFAHCLAGLASILCVPVAFGQVHDTGRVIGLGSPVPYMVRNKAWSFEAAVEYRSQGRLFRVSHLIYNEHGAFQEEWNVANPTGRLDTAKKPVQVYSYRAGSPGIVYQGMYEMPGFSASTLVLTPARPSCLQVLLRRVAREGEAAVRRRYHIPPAINLSDPSDIVAESAIGAGTQEHTSGFFGPNFLVNGAPSGFGWPNFMFQLIVFQPEEPFLHQRSFQLVGRETAAGRPCRIYRAQNRLTTTTYWVDPGTALVLRKEEKTVAIGRMPPSSRGYEVTRWKSIPQAPVKAFDPPAGSVVLLPELLKDIPLPPGVRRKPMTGLEATLGFPTKLYPNNGVVVSP
jgi:hypothetical protein